MNRPLVTKEQAISLKELGFDWKVENSYSIKPSDKKVAIELIYAPDLDSACRWLREVKGVHVSVNISTKGKWYHLVVPVSDPSITINFLADKTNTHDEAQSAGIDAAITHLKNIQK